MKFFDIRKPREFYERVLRCSGDIREIGTDGTQRDLKSMAEYLIETGMADRMMGIPEINLSIQKPSDIDVLFNYALSMGRERICA